MSVRLCTQELFDKDVFEHQLLVLHDSGVYRHLRMKRPGYSAYHYDIVTYPGFLVYSGDMGCYVFERLPDMFQFFRSDSGQINPCYWSEKLQSGASSGRRGAFEFSPELFADNIKRRFRELWHGQVTCKRDREIRRECWEEVCDLILGVLDDDGTRAQYAAHDYLFRMPRGCTMFDGRSFFFRDFWESNNDTYTFHFLWCCYAIVRAISAYDAWCDAATEVPA